MDHDGVDDLARTMTSSRLTTTVLPRGRAVMLAAAAIGAMTRLGSSFAEAGAGKRKKKRRKTKAAPPPCPTCPTLPAPPTCDQVCGATRCLCYLRPGSSILCADSAHRTQCTMPCATDNDCLGTEFPYCLSQAEIPRSSGVRFALCDTPGAFCGSLDEVCR